AKVGTVLATPEASWHGVWSESAGAQMGAAIAAATGGEYRLWTSDSNGIYYTSLGTEMHNPLQNPTDTFARSGYIETYWMDMGWAEIDKLAFGFTVDAQNVTEENTIRILIAWDENE